MTKVSINTDKISNSLLPTAQNEKNKISSTKRCASRVSMPNGENYWGNVTSQLSDCEDKINKYINWINDLKNKVSSGMNNGVDNINKLVVDKVNTSDITVK